MPHPLPFRTAALSLLVTLLAGLLGLPTNSSAQDQDLLPVDPDVRVDTLDNGLVYYVRANDEPADRAELRLAVNIGSVVEEAGERGHAHFVEHLLFNGTERFEEQEIIDFLEGIGMRFGPDVNAYTSFDETVYMLTIPTDDEEIVTTAFDVLQDWASAATLEDEAVEKERGIIIEERRARQENAAGRMQEEIIPTLLYQSRYAERLPIGDTTVIRNAAPQTYRDFYERWYRPDLMGIVAVGDFDPDDIAQRIEQHFGDLSVAPDAPARPSVEIPDHEETQYAITSDPEFPMSSVQVAYKRDRQPVATRHDFRESLTRSMFRSMLNTRLNEMARTGEAPFLSASSYASDLARPTSFYGLTARVEDDSLLTGLEAAFLEVERIRQHGFTASELERQKTRTLRSYERSFNERDNIRSAQYVSRYVDHYLKQRPLLSTADEYALVQALLPEISLEEVNAVAADLFAEENRVVITQMPDRPDVPKPTEAEIADLLDSIRNRDIAPYEDEQVEAPLMAERPEPGRIVQEEALPYDVTAFQLSNGVRVLHKATDFKDDEVRFTAFAPGGTSLATDAEYFEASFAANLVSSSGVGALDASALDRALAGQVVSVSPFISELEQGFRGQASPEDLETLFQLVHLYATDARADSSAYRSFQNQQRSFLSNRAAAPQSAFQDSLVAALFNNDIRRRPPTVDEIDGLDLAQAKAFYDARFADAGDMTFAFVGNIDPEMLRQHAKQYLGSLPASRAAGDWRDVAPPRPEGIVEKAAYKGQAEQSQVALIFHGEMADDAMERHYLSTLENILSIRLREELREERSGVYGVQVQSSASVRPNAEYQFVVVFVTDPERVEELTTAVFDEVADLQENGATEDKLSTTKEQQRRSRETALEDNAFWLGQLITTERYPERTLEMLIDGFTERIDSTTLEDVQQAAQRYLNPEQYVNVTLFPERMAPSEASETAATGADE